MLKYEIFCFWDFYILLSKLQKIIRMLAKYYTFAGVLRMLAKYYTFTGDRFWAILRMLAKYYTFAGVLRMLAKYYTFAGVLRMLAILRMLALQGDWICTKICDSLSSLSVWYIIAQEQRKESRGTCTKSNINKKRHDFPMNRISTCKIPGFFCVFF